eukprot:scaffold55679_cov38-Tisochrysis_lutea.AAC.10
MQREDRAYKEGERGRAGGEQSGGVGIVAEGEGRVAPPLGWRRRKGGRRKGSRKGGRQRERAEGIRSFARRFFDSTNY